MAVCTQESAHRVYQAVKFSSNNYVLHATASNFGPEELNSLVRDECHTWEANTEVTGTDIPTL